MNNTIILESQHVYYLVFEGSTQNDYAHSLWSTEEDAQRMVDILTNDQHSNAFFLNIELDRKMPEVAGYEVLVNLNNGEQVADDLISMDYRCVYLRTDPPAYPYNFITPEAYFSRIGIPEALIVDGELPRKIDNKWVVQHTDDNWSTFFEYPDWRDMTKECLIGALGPTKEEALRRAREYKDEMIQILEDNLDRINNI